MGELAVGLLIGALAFNAFGSETANTNKDAVRDDVKRGTDANKGKSQSNTKNTVDDVLDIIGSIGDIVKRYTD